MSKTVQENLKNNSLLAALEPEDYEALMGAAKVVTLKLGRLLYRQDGPIDAVYFPLTCMVSLMVVIDDTPGVEMAMVGKEGVVGGPEVIHNQLGIGSRVVQLPGRAVRVNADALQKVLSCRPRLLALMHQHLLAELRQILYVAACNRLHSMEERCVRWILMTHDRAGADSFPLTQEFLARMLNVRRASVNIAMGMLKKAGFIRYVRGQVTIIDGRGLEAASCGCYQAIVRAYHSILPGTPRQGI